MRLTRRHVLRLTFSTVEMSTQFLNLNKRKDDQFRIGNFGAVRGPSGECRVHGESSAATRQDQRHPREEKDNVGALEPRRRVKTHREEESQTQQRSTECREASPKAEQGTDTHRHFGDSNDDAERNSYVLERTEEKTNRAPSLRAQQLSLDGD